MMIVALDAPDFRTISDFRKRHLPALARLGRGAIKHCGAEGPTGPLSPAHRLFRRLMM